jgi:hypothetical protein
MRHPSSARLGFPTRNDEAVKASLAAVRAAREAARQRSRRQGWTTRISALALIGAAAAMWPMIRGHHQKGVTASAPVRVTTPLAKPTLAAEVAAPAPPMATSNVRAAEAPAEIAVDTEACDQSFASHQWRVAAEQCELAFTAAPSRADLALKIAKAQHARAHFRESVTWAQNTLKLEASNAEAFAIIARSERRAGHTAEAAAAYRRYLSLAPHGWHAHEARTALRASSGLPETAPHENGLVTVSQTE